MGMGVKAAHCYLCAELLPQRKRKEEAVSRFGKVSHTIWHCQYHVVWVPKYRFRILQGAVKASLESGIQAICGFAGCKIVEMNVQPDHVHLVVMVPAKVSISELLGRLEGQSSMRMFQQFRHLKKKPYWGNHFWAKGYCVDTLGLDADMIRKYVRYQEKKEQEIEQLQLIG
jgi:putative transposase